MEITIKLSHDGRNQHSISAKHIPIRIFHILPTFENFLRGASIFLTAKHFSSISVANRINFHCLPFNVEFHGFATLIQVIFKPLFSRFPFLNHTQKLSLSLNLKFWFFFVSHRTTILNHTSGYLKFRGK